MKRWIIIRHIRYYILARKAQAWASMWARAGIGLGYINESDERALNDIWDGKA